MKKNEGGDAAMTPGLDLLGDTIRTARMKKGYTQEVFAEMLDDVDIEM